MHMTNGASFNLTNKNKASNIENISNGDGNGSYNNQMFVPSNGSEGMHGFNIKNSKNVLSGPLNSHKTKPIGSSHMDHRDKKMKDAYKNAKPKSKGGGMGNFNNQAALQYSQNNFIQNKPQFSTFYGQGQLGNQVSANNGF
jgi:hypothetical protein